MQIGQFQIGSQFQVVRARLVGRIAQDHDAAAGLPGRPAVDFTQSRVAADPVGIDEHVRVGARPFGGPMPIMTRNALCVV